MSEITDVAKDIREQLCGQGARESGYPGWPQLGTNPDGSNRTVVDGLAVALAALTRLETKLDALAAKGGTPTAQAQ